MVQIPPGGKRRVFLFPVVPTHPADYPFTGEGLFRGFLYQPDNLILGTAPEA
jgi:hypothetical protein